MIIEPAATHDSARYSAKDFAATTRHASTSVRLRVGEAQRTALIESKVISENGSLIDRANSCRTTVDIFL